MPKTISNIKEDYAKKNLKIIGTGKKMYTKQVKECFIDNHLVVNDEMSIKNVKEFKYLGQMFSFDYQVPRKNIKDVFLKFIFTQNL